MITYTTFFYELGRSDPYYGWINTLLSFNINLVFYTTKDIHDKLTYAKRDNLLFVFQELDMKDVEKFKESWFRYKTTNKSKDTYKFAHLTHLKFTHVLQTINSNPFSTDYFGWIDAGIAKIAEKLEMIESMQPKNERVQFLVMSGSTHRYMEKGFVLSPKQMIAGGHFIGEVHYMITFCELMLKERVKKDLGLEQEHMVCVYMENKHLFRPYYGYYSQIISQDIDQDFVYKIMIDLLKMGDSEGLFLFDLLDELKYPKLDKIRNHVQKVDLESDLNKVD